jgi:hypothetical protein
MRHGRLRYEAGDGSSLRYAVPLIVTLVAWVCAHAFLGTASINNRSEE